MITKGQTRKDIKHCPLCNNPFLCLKETLECNHESHSHIDVNVRFYSNGHVDSVYLCINNSNKPDYSDYYAVHVFYGEGDVYIAHYIKWEKKGQVILKDLSDKFPIKAYAPKQLNTYILFS